MSSFTQPQRDFLPPWLLDRDDVTILSGRLSSQRVADDYAKYTYTVQWEEPYEPSVANSTLASSTSNEFAPVDVKSKGPECPSGAISGESAEDISLMSRLSRRSSGAWTEPNECEMIPCRAILIEKDITGSDVRMKLFAEHPATARLSEVVEDLLTSAENCGKNAKVFVIPVAKGKGLKLMDKDEMERKMVKNLERHRGSLCLVIDNTSN